ncbi:hypothetical protein CVS40_3828 [Lucilia cuprina]|nr:hypothetical protein CVS40_3828 [Lucilia cuprina]
MLNFTATRVSLFTNFLIKSVLLYIERIKIFNLKIMEIQQLEILDQVISNPYLLANIFKYTNLQTQLKLAKICNYFQNVILDNVVFPNLIELYMKGFKLLRGYDDFYCIFKAFPNIRKLCIENCFGDSFKAPILRKENVPSDIFELLVFLQELKIKHFKRYTPDGKFFSKNIYLRSGFIK